MLFTGLKAPTLEHGALFCEGAYPAYAYSCYAPASMLVGSFYPLIVGDIPNRFGDASDAVRGSYHLLRCLNIERRRAISLAAD